MLLEIFDIIYIISINFYASLIDAKNRPTIHVVTFLIDNRNNNNNYERNLKVYTLAMKYQKIIKKSISLFLINNIYKYIKFIYF